MTRTCPSCGRACAERATWCIGCRYDFDTGQVRGAAADWQSVIPVGDTMNLSMIHAPLLVVGSANLRGIKKLSGR